MSTYNKDAVEKAIKSSRKPISKKGNKLIHRLLKGHSVAKVVAEQEKRS